MKEKKENVKLQIRINIKRKCVEIEITQFIEDKTLLQRGVDFFKSIYDGLDDLYVESKDGCYSLQQKVKLYMVIIYQDLLVVFLVRNEKGKNQNLQQRMQQKPEQFLQIKEYIFQEVIQIQRLLEMHM
ncbi:unnamed protein product [Paramecium sonneborni]|uniref:Uncharacterized protein n=1 Tax=Paramecium sonneborni TaxID=65129 RepID=A0A8S1RTP7_9CILI|nr:unnamed protein product [Paramecium sonneborni]